MMLQSRSWDIVAAASSEQPAAASLSQKLRYQAQPVDATQAE
jgi:hypothetical protein